MRYRYGRKTKGNPGILGVIIALIIITNLGVIFEELLGGLLELAIIIPVLGITLLPAILTGVGLFFLIRRIVKAIRGEKVTKKDLQKAKNTNADTTALLKQLTKYFNENNTLNIDEETYLVLADKDNISLKSMDIYMRDEYIGTLQDYLTAYPNAYNSLANLITKYLKKTQKAKKKAEATVTPEAPKKEEKKEAEKDAAYYIRTLKYLNDQNPNEQVTAGLNETCEHLAAIKKIEDEYPESKNKTIKLYEFYLPMLTDILANYNRLTNNTSNPADFKASEDRLLKTIVLINGALKTISSGLLEDYYSEINVDMRTLESILKKDGLVEDFKQEG